MGLWGNDRCSKRLSRGELSAFGIVGPIGIVCREASPRMAIRELSEVILRRGSLLSHRRLIAGDVLACGELEPQDQ